MKNKILIVYQFATFGGVERVLLNRAEAFKYFKLNYKLYVYFYEDYGAKKALKNYINNEGLNEYIEIINKFKPQKFDYIVSIDTPQIFNNKKIEANSIIVETHTIEKQYRKYLDDCIENVNKIIVPSKTFYNTILNEYKAYFDSKKFTILGNFVPWDIKKNKHNCIELPHWNKNIIFYYGRIDTNKNIKEIIKVLKYYNNRFNDNLLLLLIGKIDPNYDLLNFIYEQEVIDKVVILPPINFDKIETLLNTMKKNKAIFVSSSKGETFSLSAAEAISYEIPVVLSDIDAHRTLIKNNSKFLYQLDNGQEMAEKIENIINNYDELSIEIKKYKSLVSTKNFIKEWENNFPNKY